MSQEHTVGSVTTRLPGLFLSSSLGVTAHLLVGPVEQLVPVGAPHGVAEAVDGMQGSQEEGEQTQLLPHRHPLLQPGWEMTVLSACTMRKG